jgi:hypothetical protein
MAAPALRDDAGPPLASGRDPTLGRLDPRPDGLERRPIRGRQIGGDPRQSQVEVLPGLPDLALAQRDLDRSRCAPSSKTFEFGMA